MKRPSREDLVRTMRRLNICVVVPTYNNASTLRQVLEDVLLYADDVIVVNDGSTDATESVLRDFDGRIIVRTHPRNKGKGTALKTGFTTALKAGYDYAITIDSDGQHYADDIPAFVEAVATHPGALIVGERDLSGVDINGKSSFANKFSNFWFRLQTGRNLRDTQTGFRAYPLRSLYGMGLLTSRYEAELELMVFASWNGVPFHAIPIKVYYPPQAERVSHFRPALDFTRISILNTVLCAGAIVYGAPARMWNAVRQKRVLSREFRSMTHRKGERKEAASTLGRMVRSIYGLLAFTFLSVGVFKPMAEIWFKVGKNTEKKKLRYHGSLQWVSRFFVKHFPGADTRYENFDASTFNEPSLVICNHQSHLDLPIIMATDPKLIFLTKDWVWDNKFFGSIIHNAEYLPVSVGIDAILPHLRDLKRRGYSIVIFPEGTRSDDCTIHRFHQGAFYLARELDMDIQPMVLHGAGHYLPKKDLMFRKGKMTLRALPRVSREEIREMAPLKQASHFRRMIRSEFEDIIATREKGDYFRSLALYKYAWRGWRVVSRCKHTLRGMKRCMDVVDNGRGLGKVRILNSGIGTFALIYALVNKQTEVWAYESEEAAFRIASETAGLPDNLHLVHAVWESDYGDGKDFDLTIRLDSPRGMQPENDREICLTLKS